MTEDFPTPPLPEAIARTLVEACWNGFSPGIGPPASQGGPWRISTTDIGRIPDMPAEPVLDADEFSAAVSAVTSAFGDPTRRDIYLAIRKTPDGVTAADVAERFALHPNVARHHLEKLSAGGYVTVDVGRADGARAAGRPSKRYRVPEHDSTLSFPPRRDDLLATLLARALDVLPPDQAEAMAEEVGFEYGRTLAERMAPSEGHRSVKAALATVAEALTAHGFACARRVARHVPHHRVGALSRSAQPRSSTPTSSAPWTAASSAA